MDNRIDPMWRRHGAVMSALRRAWPCLLALTACGHAARSKPPDTSPERASAPAAAPSRPVPPAHDEQYIEDFMVDHFVIVTFSRDAVINGDLEALREPLRALADYDYEDVAPGGWWPWIARLQAAARLTSDAATLEAAAGGVATMVRVCGGCHEESAGGPDFESSGAERKTPPSDTLDSRMERHIWAADRLWEGLTGPSDEAWEDGASALAHTPAATPVTDPPLPPQFAAALQATRAFAEPAAGAENLAERADVYGAFLATCAGCHARGAVTTP